MDRSGRVTAAAIAVGRRLRRRIADLMIAATAIDERLPLFPDENATPGGIESYFGEIREAMDEQSQLDVAARYDIRQGVKEPHW